MIKEYDCLRGPSFQRRSILVIFVEIERMVKYKTNDIIKNINECVNLINSARVQKIFLGLTGKQKDGWQLLEATATRL